MIREFRSDEVLDEAAAAGKEPTNGGIGDEEGAVPDGQLKKSETATGAAADVEMA